MGLFSLIYVIHCICLIQSQLKRKHTAILKVTLQFFSWVTFWSCSGVVFSTVFSVLLCFALEERFQEWISGLI